MYQVLAPLLAAAVLGASSAVVDVDAPKSCDNCAAWNTPHEPFHLFGNTWYVGVSGLSSILIASGDDAILIDGDLAQSAPLIAANIRKLGFKLGNVRFILNSHTHYDHAGGIAALQRATHATVAASPAAKRALENGGPTADDPQFAFGAEHNSFAAVRDVRVLADGETLRVGTLAVTAHFTPGHTPGGTTWTWRSCEQEHCIDIVYADSLNSISAPGFRFTGDATHASRVAEFERSIATVAALPCDLLLAPHPESVDLEHKFAAFKQTPAINPFIDPTACRNYAAGAHERLERRVADERAAK